MTDCAQSLLCEHLAPIRLPLVNKFYAAEGARGRANRAERVYVARLDGEIVAACRVQRIAGHDFLTGVYVAARWRGRSVARNLLGYVCAEQASSLYSFPYRYLLSFYRSLGFSPCTLPEELASRFRAYAEQGRDIVACCYVPPQRQGCKAKAVG